MNYTLLAQSTIVCSALSLLCLIALHFTSPQFKPSWRMISEYALGKHKWLLTAFFFLWGVSSLLLSFLLWQVVDGTWPIVAVVLLFLSGIGEIMGGLFDVRHKLHGAAFGLGIPTLPVAALILSYHAGGASTLVLSAHLTWISVVLMAVCMIVMISGFKKSGIPMGPDMTPPENVPPGVIALAGYANRFLVLCYIGWLVIVANLFLN